MQSEKNFKGTEVHKISEHPNCRGKKTLKSKTTKIKVLEQDTVQCWYTGVLEPASSCFCLEHRRSTFV
jgi:hypothetical protein